ncbi:MAG: GNAT family N-acetyltransferase [Lachnospiraceae bacterium]|nr:GNAT family N-acetyltransferase [Lachnospiraceae bacterium]
MINIKKLERVLLDIQDANYKKNAVELQKRNNEIPFFCMVEDSWKKCKKDDLSEKEVWIKNTEPGSEIDIETCLYVTDDVQRAQNARNRGFAVLIYLHDGNKEMNFTGFRYLIEGFEDADYDYFNWVYTREKGMPWMIGETERIVLREMVPEDTDALYALYEDKSVVEFMEDLPENKEEEREYIRDYIDKVYNFFGFGMWLAEHKESGEIIGRVGFQNCEEDWTAELGFLIKPEYQGQGYAYEACSLAMEYMWGEHPEYHLMARCMQGNKKAVALCEKLGISYVII